MKKMMQISPYGIFEKIEEDGSRRLQLCDAVAFNIVVQEWIARGRPKILLDYIHSRGEAAGWFVDLSVDPSEGLVGEIEYTVPGALAIAQKLWRFPSVDWDVGADNRPIKLHTVALTNTPNIPVKPLSNSAVTPDGGKATQPKQPSGRINMELIIEKLGLAADADEAAIVAAIQALLDQIAEAEAQAGEAKAKSVAAANVDRIENSEAFLAATRLNPAAVEAALAALKPATARLVTRVINSAEATQPAPAATATRKFESPEAARKAMADLPVDKRQAFYDEHKNEIEG